MLHSSEIARVAYEVNRAYCEALGDMSQKPWDEAPDWQKASAIRGVEFHLANPTATPEDYFAMCLLMPEQFVRRDIEDMGGIDLTEDRPIRDLAKRYQVSVAMMTLRLAQLGLVQA